MARLSKPDLLYTVTSAIAECGWHVLYMDDQHPFRLQVYSGDASIPVRIYIWNITHGGGRARPAHEYRIQITGVGRFESEPNGKTLILGWWDEAGVFAGFDFNKHRGLLGASPSLQIHKECLQQAYVKGFAPCLKENQEIAIAFRPEFLIEYIANLESLHGFGESLHDLSVLESIASDPNAVNDADIQIVGQDRRRVVRSVQQRLRSASFKSRVLTAYNHSCAFCGLQLNLIQAAHILPVSHDNSTDDTHNGIASCFLHHAAYDRGLVTFDKSYVIKVNEEETRRLADADRIGGLDKFRKGLRPLILLPPAIIDRPHVEFVNSANQIRGWRL